mmetsp:Transcript_60150/g.113474  ORF Transcript_60150/g.113474 Transcript_60150/m.113474 type:complete len:547 (+) Transcript_60150:66-1706(+)
MAEIQFLPEHLDESTSRSCASGSRTTATFLVVSLGLTASSYSWTNIDIIRALTLRKPGETSGISAAVLVGFILGSIGIGALADRHGRLVISSLTAFLLLGSIGGTCAGGMASLLGFPGAHALCAELAVWNFLLGLGIGGEYALAAVYIVESFCTNVAGSVRALSGAYACIAVGRLLAPLVAAAGLGLHMSAEASWRSGLALVVALSLGSLAARCCLAHETPPFLEQRQASVGAGAVKRAGMALVCRCPQALGRALLGTCLASFLQGLASGGLLLGTSSLTFLHRWTYLDEEVSGQLVAALMSFPGYIAAFALAKHGRRIWQLAGFGAMAVGFLGLAVASCTSQTGIQASLCSMLLVLSAGGPGATTYFVPAEVFPTCVRASCMGITLAAGCAGWAVAMTGLQTLLNAAGTFVAMLVCAMVCAAGVVSTFFLTPQYSKQTLRSVAQIGPGKDKRESTVEALERCDQFRQCPSCEVMVERSGGCNVITCGNCQDVWCFACGGRGCHAWACSGIEADGCITLEALPRLLWPDLSARACEPRQEAESASM